MGLWMPPVTLDNPGFTVWPCACAKLTHSFQVSLEPISRGSLRPDEARAQAPESHTRAQLLDHCSLRDLAS